jgi:hypothetical protein
MRRRVPALVLPLALGIAACGREPVAPVETAHHDLSALQQQDPVEGTGLVLGSRTVATIPLIRLPVGDVVIDQVVIKEFGVVEDLVGNIVGLSATGVLELTGGVFGQDVVTEDFTTEVLVISSRSRGQCEIITIDLATAAEPIEVDVLGRTAFVDLPAAEVTGRGNGALGSLLCALGQALQPVVSGVTRGVRGLVNAINNILI